MDWQKLLELAPLALAKPGSPQAMAILQGYQHSMERRKQEQLQQQQLAGQDQLRQAQLQNIAADNARATEQLGLQTERLALDRLSAYRREDQGTLGALAQAPDIELAPETTPLSAQNDLTVERLTAQQAYRVPPGTPQPPLPNMTALVSEAKKRRAKALYEAAEKAFGAEAMAGDSLMLQSEEFGDVKGEVKPSALRALFGVQAVDAMGVPAAPYVKSPTIAGTETERAHLLLEKIDAAKAAGDTAAAAKFTRQYQNLVKAKQDLGRADDRPREPSARDVGSAREAAYQAVLAGSNVTVAARALRQAGLDPEIELGRIRREVEADVRRVEAQLPTDRYGEDRTDPAVLDARMKRARDILRGGGGAGASGGSAVTPPAPAGASTMSRAELRAVAKRLRVTEAEAERQAGERGLTVVP